MTTPDVVVVGAANVDVEAAVTGPTVPGDSNIGTVRRGAGGVGRNIVETLARVGVATRLVTVFDDGADGRWLAGLTRAAGVDLGGSAHLPDVASTYVSVVDADGELVVAVNDMRAAAAMDATFLAARDDAIGAGRVLVVDANLGAGAVAHLASAHPDATVVADPVSVAKARRLVPHLGWLHTVKPNRDELAALADTPVATNGDLDRAVDVLLRAGVARLVVSLGGDGLLVATPDGRERLPVRATRVTSVTGAGDAMTAGLALGLAEGWSARESARAGQAMASLTARVASSVDPALTRARVDELLEAWT